MKIGSLIQQGNYSRLSASPGASSPLSRTLESNNKFINAVEKHLDDVQKGQGYLSASTHRALVQKNAGNGSFLGQTNPEALRIYSGIVSGLKYQQSSRLIAGVEQGNKTASRIYELEALDTQKLTDDLVQKFSAPVSSYADNLEEEDTPRQSLHEEA